MQPARSALLEALSEAGLARRWQADVLGRAQALVTQVREFEFAQQGAISATQARVQGSALYRVHLTHSPGAALRGDCDCPHAAGGQACKHQAALALAWRLHLGGAALQEPAPPAPTVPKAEPDWAVFVRAQPAAELAERLLRWAAQSPELRRELQAWQQAATPVADLAQARKVLTTLLAAPRDLVDWRKVGAYVRKAQAVLGLLAGWIERDAALGLAAAEHAWLGLWKLLEQADDSNGEIQGLIRDIGALWLAALRRLGPQPAAFAERLLKLHDADDCGYLPLSDALAAAGPLAAERVRKLVQQRWDETRALGTDPGQAGWRAQHDYLAVLQALGDEAERLRVLRLRLVEPYHHLQLVETLAGMGRVREAVQAAEAGLRLHPGERRLEQLLIAAYERDGCDEEALALRQSAFERNPGQAEYHALCAAAAACGRTPAAFRAALWQRLHALHAQQRGYRAEGLAGLMLRLWVDEADFDTALRWLEAGHAVPVPDLLQLATALPAAEDAAAAALFKRALGLLMPGAKPPFRQELQIVQATLARLTPEAGRLWLAWLRLEYRAKTRFMAELAGL